jgi:hypothetical protein
MAYTISPNMNLIVPTVGSESGPQYATDVNNSLTLVDQHDHSTGKGVQIQPDGLNISSALTFQNNPLTNAQYLNMYLQTTAPTVAQSLYVKDGSESPALPDLWYFDGTNQIQITSGGQLAPVTASISGITYAGGTFSFEQNQSSLPTTPANLSAGSIIIRPNTAATAYGVELNPPSAIASQYSLFLPSVPANLSFLTIDSGGNIGTASNVSGAQIEANTITGSQLVNNTITATQIANNTITTNQISNSAAITVTQLQPITSFTASFSGSNSTTSTSYTNIVSVNATGLVVGRPVFITFTGQNGYFGNVGTGNTVFRVAESSTATILNTFQLDTASNVTTSYHPPSSMNTVDFGIASSSVSYVLQAASLTGVEAYWQNITINVFQL